MSLYICSRSVGIQQELRTPDPELSVLLRDWVKIWVAVRFLARNRYHGPPETSHHPTWAKGERELQ